MRASCCGALPRQINGELVAGGGSMVSGSVTQACMAGGRGSIVLELNITIIKGDVQASDKRRPVEAGEAGEADLRLGTKNLA